MEYHKQLYEKAQKEENKWEVCKHSDGIVNNVREGTSVWKYCGMVKDYRVIDESAEWRNFGNDGSGKSDGGTSSGDRTGGKWDVHLDSYGVGSTITSQDGGDCRLK